VEVVDKVVKDLKLHLIMAEAAEADQIKVVEQEW
jgi:hypothetical protein